MAAARGVERAKGRRAGAEQAYRETLTKFGKRSDLAATPSEGQLAKAGEMFGPTHIAEPGASLPAPRGGGTVPVRPEYDLEGFADDLIHRANEIIKPVEAEIRGLAQARWHSPGGRFLSGAEKDRALRARGYRQLGASARGKNIPGKTLEDYYPDAVAELTAAGREDVAAL